jgi:hypothetical protein
MKDGRRFGRPPNPYTPPPLQPGKINLTDPDSRNVKAPRGYMQGYNAQAVQKAAGACRDRAATRAAGLVGLIARDGYQGTPRFRGSAGGVRIAGSG